jgi:hypothetical protein
MFTVLGAHCVSQRDVVPPLGLHLDLDRGALLYKVNPKSKADSKIETSVKP